MKDKLLKIQQEIKPIVKNSQNPHFKNTYFDINKLLEEVKPILNTHGVVIMQKLTIVDGKNGLKTELIDSESGESIDSECLLPDIQDPQKIGSAITYFRRYSLQTLLALEAEDDEGESVRVSETTNNKFTI